MKKINGGIQMSLTYDVINDETIETRLDKIIELLREANSNRDEIIAILQDFYMDNKKEVER